MKALALVLAVLLVVASGLSAPAVASLPSIGLYFDPDCATCSMDATLGVLIVLYVNAQLGGRLSQGFLGAECSVFGIPADWSILDVTPNPAASVVLGNPVGEGCNIAFQQCQGPPGGCVNLFVIRILPVSLRSNVRSYVRPHTRPSCPGFCCAWLWACDAPIYTQYCAWMGQAWINGPPCSVGVVPGSWGSVKQLYQ